MNMRSIVVALSAASLATPAAFSQGPLNPPGPPAATMKSLDELDAKLNQADAKAEKRTPISSLPFTISAPGSYYLTGNLTNNNSAENGINITASNVTIDLMGFALTSAGPTSSGVVANSPVQNVTVRNGFVTGWLTGVKVTVRGARVQGITATNNSSNGIECGSACLVVDCVSGGNGNNGIDVGGDGVVVRCVTRENGADGIETGFGAVVSQSSSRENGGFGINVDVGSLVQACASFENVGTNIRAAAASTIARCTAAEGKSHGISVSGDCLVLENNCRSNGLTTQAGIFVAGTNNRIEGNHSMSNTSRGIEVAGPGNLVVKNTATNHGPTANYVIVAGNKVGEIQVPSNNAAIAGNVGGGLGAAETRPWANFAY